MIIAYTLVVLAGLALAPSLPTAVVYACVIGFWLLATSWGQSSTTAPIRLELVVATLG